MECSCDLSQIDLLNPPLDCPKTWDLIGRGNTKGIFQLESQLGRSLAKQLKPENMEHLAGLISVMRPACLDAKLEGLSLTQHYINRKNNLEPVTYFHPSLEPILNSTYGILIFQEEATQIGTDVAAMSLSEADYYIRYGLGKKRADIIAEGEKIFLEGCKKTQKVNDDEAKEMFEWIRAGQRYSFNHCLNPNTLVELESQEYITLEELQIGQKIKCPISVNYDDYTQVINKFNTGYKQVYEIETESGLTIECTLDHQFLCEDGKKRKLEKIFLEGHKIMCDSVYDTE